MWGGVIVNEVIYYGKKYGSDKDAFLDNADIFVFPTYYPNECFPLVLLEAMQHWVPCITTREGGIPSIIEDGKNGLLVERKNADDLANKIAWMIDHSAGRQTMRAKGLRMFTKEFTLSNFESRMKAVLSEALS